MYDLVEVHTDGKRRTIAEGYPSRGYAYASATKLIIEAPDQVTQIDVVDDNGNVRASAKREKS